MSDDAPEDCTPVHRILAGHILHAVNLGYDDVAVTHLRIYADDTWEAEIVLESLGVSYVARSTCPLEAALEVAAEVVETCEAMRECVAANVLN